MHQLKMLIVEEKYILQLQLTQMVGPSAHPL